jgi:hypothetical protein
MKQDRKWGQHWISNKAHGRHSQQVESATDSGQTLTLWGGDAISSSGTDAGGTVPPAASVGGDGRVCAQRGLSSSGRKSDVFPDAVAESTSLLCHLRFRPCRRVLVESGSLQVCCFRWMRTWCDPSVQRSQVWGSLAEPGHECLGRRTLRCGAASSRAPVASNWLETDDRLSSDCTHRVHWSLVRHTRPVQQLVETRLRRVRLPIFATTVAAMLLRWQTLFLAAWWMACPERHCRERRRRALPAVASSRGWRA